MTKYKLYDKCHENYVVKKKGKKHISCILCGQMRLSLKKNSYFKVTMVTFNPPVVIFLYIGKFMFFFVFFTF